MCACDDMGRLAAEIGPLEQAIAELKAAIERGAIVRVVADEEGE